MSTKHWLLMACGVIISCVMMLPMYQAIGAPISQGTIPQPSDTPTATPTDTGAGNPTPTMTPTYIPPTSTIPTPIPPQPTSTPAPISGPDILCTHNPWRFTTNMTTKRLYHAAAVANEFIYVLGSYLYTGVERAQINVDGTLGPWQRVNQTLQPRFTPALVAVNGYLYALGGQGSDLDSVEYAKVNSDGSLSDWQFTSRMQSRRERPAAVAANGYLYAMGGDADPTGVERAQILSDGSLGSWEFMNHLNYGRSGRNAVVAHSAIYVVGDATTGQSDTIERATINADGTLSNWQTIGLLPVHREVPAVVANDNFLYVLGGYTNATNYNTVMRALIQADGTLGPFLFVDAMHFERQNPAALLHNSRLYVFGGADYRNANTEESVEWAELAALAVAQDYGMTINQGALFTNQTAVTLSITGRTGTTEMQVSNDGGFAGATWENCRATKPWEITRFGNSILPRTVYIRYRDTQGTVSGVFQDDIILDVTAPSGSVEILPIGNLQQQRQQPAIGPAAQGVRPTQNSSAESTVYLPLVSTQQTNCPAVGTANVTVNLTAQDDVSGVADMLISNSAGFACAVWQPFKATQSWFVPTGATTTVYAQFRDNAGNVSAVVEDMITLPPQ